MPLSNDALIESSKQLLTHYRQLGLEQIETYKELNPGSIRRTLIDGRMMGELNGVFMPIDDVTRRIVAEEDTFLVNMLNGFWDYYLLNTNSLDSPARQGIDRTLLELCFQKLLPFSGFTPAEKKRTLLISNICDVGMILAAPSDQDRPSIPKYTSDYDYWTSQLSREDDRTKFQQLQSNGYPTHAFAKAKHKLWPSFYTAFSDNLESLVFPWAGETAERIESVRESTLRMYQHQHDFVHGSYTSALIAVEDMSTKKHIFTSVAISTQAGYQLLSIVNRNYLGNRAINLDSLTNETSQLIQPLINTFSHM